MDQYTPEEQKKALREVFDRMVEKGWLLQAASNDENASLAYTDEGVIARVLLRRMMYDEEGLTGAQISAFFSIIGQSPKG